MASIQKLTSGRWILQYVDRDGGRKTISLGRRMSERSAQHCQWHIEQLVEASITGVAVRGTTAAWVADLGATLHSRLAAHNLVEPREPDPAETESAPAALTLRTLIDDYIRARTDVKRSTIWTFQRVRNHMVKFFGAKRLLTEISPGDADDFARWLVNPKGGHVAVATARRTIGRAKQVFTYAVRRKLVESNPFQDLAASVPANRARDYFVNGEDVERIIEAAPDAEWRALIALSRWGGLRIPSEALALTWGDIDWHRKRMVVRSPKTEHHEGGAYRTVPLFPELEPYLHDAFVAAADGAEHVITRYRDRGVNLRTQFAKIIRRAGLSPWPKLWQNMRASRATELAAQHPAHVAAEWMGHSRLIAERHYLQVREADFEKALHRALQHTRAGGCTAVNGSGGEEGKPAKFASERRCARVCNNGDDRGLGDTGLEPVTSCMSSTRSSQLS